MSDAKLRAVKHTDTKSVTLSTGGASIGHVKTQEWAALIVRAVNTHDALVATLTGVLDKYVELVESGDCGSWDVFAEPEVITARALLSALREAPEPPGGDAR